MRAVDWQVAWNTFILPATNDTEDLRQTIRHLLIEMLHSDATLRAELQLAAVVRPLTTAEAGVAYAPAASAELTDYLDFSDPPAIRLRGHRIWIEDVFYEHVYRALNADELVARFPTFTLAEIYAVLLYYHRHQTVLDRRLVRPQPARLGHPAAHARAGGGKTAAGAG